MIPFLPLALFLVALAVTYRASGVWRLAATAVMLGAVAASVGILLDPLSGIALMAGPAIATLGLRRPPRDRLDFEALSRRAIGIAAAGVIAVFVASKFPVGENAVVLSAVPWLLIAVGAAWMVRPLDAQERIQGLVCLIAGGAAVLLVAIPGGPVTAGLAGSMALLPVIARRWPLGTRLGPSLRTGLIVAASLCALIAVSPLALPHLAIGDLTVALDGPVLVGAATLLLAGVLLASRLVWAPLPGIVSLLAVAPALRWAGLAALIAVLTIDGSEGERPAWLALALLGMSPLFTTLVAQPWSVRAAVVLLALGLVVITASSRRLPWGGVALTATTLVVLLAMRTMTAGTVARFQWIAAAGALLMIARPLTARSSQDGYREPLRDALLGALLLIAVSSRDALGLGALAAVLLVIDLAFVRRWPLTTEAPSTGWFRRIDLLARSNWPPGVGFAAGVLTVTAALQASLALGLLAAAMLAALQLSPIRDRARSSVSERRPLISWLVPAVSVACGLAPALVLRMLRL